MKDEDIKTLTDLGLTFLQAKAYLTLIELGESSIKTIAKTSKIARQNMYQIMLSLQEQGLIEKILATPIKFRGLPLKEAAEKLFRNRTGEYLRLEAETEELIKKSDENHSLPEETHEFVLIPEKEAHGRRIDQAFNNAQKSIHTIMTYVGEPGLEDLPKGLQDAIARGVKVRTISNQPANKKSADERKKAAWTKKGAYEIRYTNTPIPVMFCSVDRKELFLALEPKPNPNTTGALWTNNPGLITIIEDFFDWTWRKSKPMGYTA